ncbi:MAG: ABC transporter ATP-binding protein [Candidatus Sumerlaeia bacterium]|nr:ABC transporter ATP-binding protein [Candidatus Sumerlaeia bacterium]
MPLAPAGAEPAIEARALAKEFVSHRTGATSLKEMIVRNHFDRGERVVTRALDGIDFEVPRGCSFAVVGNNGSGKSTLLRLIAGVGRPTSGALAVRGRVAALLELGAGFHPELTGMENIFLQAGITGMPREEVLARLDAILAFAELGDFIHTPMKRYSSGMHVRLGFAVAAHSDAEIVLLDEVLAVGDAYFQSKCLRAVERMRDEGRTVFLVSHNHAQVEAVADRVLWLEKGRVKALGPADEVLDDVFDMMQEGVRRASEAAARSHGEQVSVRDTIALSNFRAEGTRAHIRKVEILDPAGEPTRRVFTGEPFRVAVEFEVLEPLPEGLQLDLGINSVAGLVSAYVEERESLRAAARQPGRYRVVIEAPDFHQPPTRYVMTVVLIPEGRPNDWYDLHLRLYPFTVRERGKRLSHLVETLALPAGSFHPAPTAPWISDSTTATPT